VKALLEVGYGNPRLPYSQELLIGDILRFPSMLAAPPDRILGWRSLMNAFSVADRSGLFGNFMRKASFMYYMNAPHIFDINIDNDGFFLAGKNEKKYYEQSECKTVATASGFVAYDAVEILTLLRDGVGITDMDKVIRTQPTIILQSYSEVQQRVFFLFNLFRCTYDDFEEYESGFQNINESSVYFKDDICENKKIFFSDRFEKKMLLSLILTYPAVLSIQKR
jgi:hypothetical protein